MFACKGGPWACFRHRCARLCTLTFIGSLGAVGCGSGAESWLTGEDLRPTLGATITSGDDSTKDDLLDTAGLADGSAVLSFSARPAFCCNPLLINFTAELSGAASSAIATAAWDFGDGRTAIGPAVQHTYRWPDEYEVVLTVHLGDGTELVDRQHLALGSDQSGLNDAAAGGTALLVDAGPDQQVTGGDTVTLTGSVSRPGIAGEPQFVWSQKAGLPATLSGINTATVSFVAPDPADTTVTLLFELTVTDGDSVAFDEVKITVSPLLKGIRDNTPPTAYDQSASVHQDESIVVGLAASDPDGDDLTFFVVAAPVHGTVSLIDGGPPDATTASYTPDRGFSGADTFTIRANDGLADSNTATVTINVLPVTSPPVVEDLAYLVLIDTPSSITLRGSAETGTELTFSISAAPLQGTLGAIDNSRSQTATVTYTPNSGFQGTDTFGVRAGDGYAVSEVATITVRVTKLIVPWMEVNSPRSSASTLYTPEQGAEPGMSILDYCLAGLEFWGRVTDTVIITTRAGQVQNLYPELMQRKPAHMRIIGGVKTVSVLHGAPGDDRPYDYANAAGWALLADKIEEIVQVTGMNTVLFENETALERFHVGQAGIDLDKLASSLASVRSTEIETWWALPAVLPNSNTVPDRLEQTVPLVQTIAEALPNCTFSVSYVGWHDWMQRPERLESQRLMLDLVGPDRMQEGMFVTEDGYVHYSNSQRRAYTVAEALTEIAALPGNVIRVFPGAANWIVVGQEFAERLPPLAQTRRGD